MIKFVSKAYTLQDETTCDEKNSSAGELSFKEQYIRYTKEKTKWYWDQKNQQQFIIFPTHTIIHPCTDVVA